jgi:hypothetical protein
MCITTPWLSRPGVLLVDYYYWFSNYKDDAVRGVPDATIGKTTGLPPSNLKMFAKWLVITIWLYHLNAVHISRWLTTSQSLVITILLEVEWRIGVDHEN